MTSPISERLQFVLDAVNGGAVVGELQRIGAAGENSQTRLQQQTQRTGEAFDQQGRSGRTSMAVISDGASRSTTMLGRMSERLGITESTLRTGIATAATVGFGLLIAKAKESIDAYVGLASEVRDFQRASGASAEESSRFVAVLDDLQISADRGAASFARLARVDPEKLAEYGIEVARAADGTVSLTETLLNVADAYAATTDPLERARLGNDTFGRSYQTLIPLLEQGRAGLESYFEGVSEGQVLSQAQLDSTRAYELAVDNLQDSLGDLSRAAGEQLVPILTTLADTTAGLIQLVGAIPTPLLQSAAAAVAFSVAAGALNRGLSGLRASRAAETAATTATNLTGMAAAAGRAEVATTRLGRTASGLSRVGVAGAAIGASIPLLQEFYDLLRGAVVDEPEVARLATSLEYLGTVGGTSGAFSDLGGIEGFNKSLLEAVQINDIFSNSILDFVGADTIARQFTQGTTEIQAYDEALASLVQGGQTEAAEEAFRQLAESAEAQGVPIETLRTLFPQYADALEDTALAEESAAEGAEAHGEAVEGTKELVDRYAEAVERLQNSLDALNGKAVTLAEADIALRDTMADLTEQVHDAIEAGDANALSLDRNTQAGRDNESALIDLIGNAQEYAEAVTNQTGSVQQGEKAFLTQIGAIRQNMQALGFNSAQVDVLLGRYARVPSRVSTAVALQDFASGGLSTVESKLRNLDGKVATVTINEITRYIIESGTPKRAGGGAVAAGTDYIVGEVRPEFFRPAVPGTIVPNTGAAQTGASSRGGDGPLMNVEQLIVRDDRDIAKVEAALAFSYATRGR